MKKVRCALYMPGGKSRLPLQQAHRGIARSNHVLVVFVPYRLCFYHTSSDSLIRIRVNEDDTTGNTIQPVIVKRQGLGSMDGDFGNVVHLYLCYTGFFLEYRRWYGNGLVW